MATKLVIPRGWAALCAASITLLAAGTATAKPEAEGERIFGTICTACHTVGGGVKVGPDLKDVALRRDRAWMKRFISDPAAVRSSGDPIAKSNVDTYKTQMPNLGLKEADVDAVIAFLGQGQAAAEGTPPQLFPTLGIGAVLLIALTAIGLIAGTKKVDEVKT